MFFFLFLQCFKRVLLQVFDCFIPNIVFVVFFIFLIIELVATNSMIGGVKKIMKTMFGIGWLGTCGDTRLRHWRNKGESMRYMGVVLFALMMVWSVLGCGFKASGIGGSLSNGFICGPGIHVENGMCVFDGFTVGLACSIPTDHMYEMKCTVYEGSMLSMRRRLFFGSLILGCSLVLSVTFFVVVLLPAELFVLVLVFVVSSTFSFFVAWLPVFSLVLYEASGFSVSV